MTKITPGNCKITMWSESAYKTPGTALAVQSSLQFDATANISESTSLPIPIRKTEQEMIIGKSTSIGANRVWTIAYEPGESTISTRQFSGILLYYIMGGCTTDYGTSTTVLGTPTLASNVLTVTDTFDVNSQIGRKVVLNDGVDDYDTFIVSNTAHTLTLASRTDLSAVSVTTATLYTDSYTHALTVNDTTVPSLQLHLEWEDINYAIDLIGCIVTELVISTDSTGSVPNSLAFTIKASESISSSILASIPVGLSAPFNFSDWDTTAYKLTYDDDGGSPPIPKNIDDNLHTDTKTWELTLTREHVIENVFGSDYPGRVLPGLLKYSLKLGIIDDSTVWETINNLKVPPTAEMVGQSGYYQTAINGQFKMDKNGGGVDMIDFVMTNMAMIPVNFMKFPSWEDKILFMDLEFVPAYDGSLTCSITDQIGGIWYEE